MLDGVTDSFDLGEEVQYILDEQKQAFKESLSTEKISNILEEKFSGKITQIPPKYSALKIDGKRAYDLARSWSEVEMKSREVEIKNIEILAFKYPKLTLRATVSAGTYIRSIAADLWDTIWSGGYISRLDRIQIGQLNISRAQALIQFHRQAAPRSPEGRNENQNNLYQPLSIQEIFPNTTMIRLSEDILTDINHGKVVYGDFDYPKNQDLFVIFDEQVTNIVHYNGEYLKPVRKI